MFNPPQNPVNGQQYTYQGRTREWDQTIGGGVGGWKLIPVSTADAEAASQSAAAAATSAAAIQGAAAVVLPASASAVSAADSAAAIANRFPDSTAALSNGVLAIASLVGGSGGASGTFNLAFSGGAGSGAAGKFVVVGGIVTQVFMTNPGSGYTSAPAISFAASAGLTGASATAVIGINVPDQKFFSTPSPLAGESAIIYQNVSNVAVEKSRVSSADAVKKPVWTGVHGGWPDTFFRRVQPHVDFLGKKRWHSSNTAIPVFTLVPGTVFLEGNALQRTLQGVVPNSGPVIQVSDLGIVPGVDSITVCGIFTGTGGADTAMPVRPYQGNTPTAGQALGLSDAGLPSITATAVPQRLRVTIPVPAGTEFVWVYPYHLTAGGSFKMEALWAFKGDATKGPEWPSVIDLYNDLKIQENSNNLVLQQAQLTSVSGAASYGFEDVTAVTGSMTVQQGVSTPTTGARGLPFRGWGESITPPGVPFNAIRIKTLTRNSGLADDAKWRTLNVLIRVGASPHLGVTPVVAVGSLRVPANTDTLNEVTILLRSPTTGALISINPSDNVFVSVWAQNSTGGPAAMGEPRATMPNTLGQSYYCSTTTATPAAETWNSYLPANLRIGFELLNVASPVEVTSYGPSQALATALAGIAPTPAPEIVVPPYLYATQGREFNTYFDNLFLPDARDYLIDVATSTNVGTHQEERLTWTPPGAQTAGTCTLSVFDKRTAVQVASATSQLRAAASSYGSGTNKLVHITGDSLIQAGVIGQTLLDIAAAPDPMSITLQGTRTTGNSLNRHEGRGGWSVLDYVGSGRVYRRFQVSGVSALPAENSSVYSIGGASYLVQEVFLTGGAGSIVCALNSGTDSPPASGTLVRAAGVPGDATITYSSSSTEPGNPYWIGGAVNFPQYLTNNSIAVPDWALIHLGINDAFGAASDAVAISNANSAFTNLDLLIASMKAAGPSLRVGLIIPSPPSFSQDAFGTSYGVGQFRARDKRNILIWARQMIAKYANQESNRIYLVPSNTALDTVNNMNVGAVLPVNSRSSLTKARQNNGVHPATSGYQQIADAIWAFLKFYAA